MFSDLNTFSDFNTAADLMFLELDQSGVTIDSLPLFTWALGPLIQVIMHHWVPLPLVV